MNSDQQNQEIEVVGKLMEFVRSIKGSEGKVPTLNFIFHPNAIGPYGIEGSQWQAVLISSTTDILDYGNTIEQAAERLLDRLLYPENYSDIVD